MANSPFKLMNRFAKIKNAFLLGYLALFLNLGPSLHRAPIFGLHNHGPVNSAARDSCCGDCKHIADREGSRNQDEDSGSGQLESQPCDECALCRFFHRYHSTLPIEVDFLFQRIIKFHAEPFAPQFITTAILSTARGPPTV